MKPDLDAIRKRLAAASPANWVYNSYSTIVSLPLIRPYDESNDPSYEDNPVVANVPAQSGDLATGRHAADAEFIFNARTDIPDLLDEIEQLRTDLQLAIKIAEAEANKSQCMISIVNAARNLENHFNSAYYSVERVALRSVLRTLDTASGENNANA